MKKLKLHCCMFNSFKHLRISFLACPVSIYYQDTHLQLELDQEFVYIWWVCFENEKLTSFGPTSIYFANTLARIFFFFFISKKFIESKKVEHPSTQGVYKGSNNQEQKLQESKKSRKDEKDWFRKAANQSIKVLKKNSFKSDMDLSLSSKHRLLG